jgi:phage terminase small subunit
VRPRCGRFVFLRVALSDKHQRFVAEYLVDLNATQAAIRAGYSEATAKQQGSRLLTNADVQAAIRDGQAALGEQTGISQVMVLERLATIAFSELGNFVSWSGRTVTLKPSEELESTAAVASISGDGEKAQIKLHDSIRALELLGRHLGMFKEGSLLGDGPIEVQLVWPEQAAQP